MATGRRDLRRGDRFSVPVSDHCGAGSGVDLPAQLGAGEVVTDEDGADRAAEFFACED